MAYFNGNNEFSIIASVTLVGNDYVNEKAANALKGAENGAIVSMDDVSPLEHKVAVKLSSETLPDNTQVTVKSCGKNLLPYPYLSTTKTQNGITFTDNGDGTVTVNGTATAATYFNIANPMRLTTGTYFFKGNTPTILVDSELGMSAYQLFIQDNVTSSNYYADVGRGVSITVNKESTFTVAIAINSGAIMDNIVFKPQLEIGTVATAYEPYKEGETVITTIAEGAELTSISPNMTIMTDTTGAVIDCSYNKDSNIVIEKLTQAIISLGGNI